MRLREAPARAIDACFRAVSVRPLAGLRVGLPLLLLVHLAWVSSDLLSLHGGKGIIPWELTALLGDPWVPGLPTLASALLPLGISASTAITSTGRPSVRMREEAGGHGKESGRASEARRALDSTRRRC